MSDPSSSRAFIQRQVPVDGGTPMDQSFRQDPAQRRRLDSDKHVEALANGVADLLIDKPEFQVKYVNI